jgi:hypothetical protein
MKLRNMFHNNSGFVVIVLYINDYSFQFYNQPDIKDCGSACLQISYPGRRMIAAEAEKGGE